MAETTSTTSIVRQAPYLEDIQRKILEQAMVRGEAPVTIPEMQVAGMDPLTEQAITAGQGIGQYQPYFTQGAETIGTGLESLQARGAGIPGLLTEAAETARTSAQVPTAAGLQPYMDPYQELVTQDALGEMQRQAGFAANQIRARQVGQGGFGGARGELELGELQRNLLDLQSRRVFEDMSKNFGQAQNAFANQQARQQSVSQLLGGIGQTAGMEAERYSKGIGAFGSAQSQLATLGQQLTGNEATTLGQLGSMRQRQSQVELDAARQSQLQQAYEPFQRISWSSDIFKPSIGSAGSTLTREVAPSPSPWSQALGMGVAAFGLQNKLGNPFSGLWSTEN